MPNQVFTPTPTSDETARAQAVQNANAAVSVPQLRVIVAQLAERLELAELEIARLKACESENAS